jgi:hypothetical protein
MRYEKVYTILDKSQLESRLKQQLKRREIMLKNHKTRMANVKNRIRNLRQMISRIKEDREIEIRAVAKMVEEFMDVELNSGRRVSTAIRDRRTMARNIFYKYGLEHGFKGPELARFTEVGEPYIITTRRREFTKSFRTCHENKEAWSNFLTFLKNNQHEPDNNNQPSGDRV